MDSPHHRKIELQAPADLTYLLSNVRAAAQSKLDSAFPPSAAPKDGEEDALRGKVEELVQDVRYVSPNPRNFALLQIFTSLRLLLKRRGRGRQERADTVRETVHHHNLLPRPALADHKWHRWAYRLPFTLPFKT